MNKDALKLNIGRQSVNKDISTLYNKQMPTVGSKMTANNFGPKDSKMSKTTQHLES